MPTPYVLTDGDIVLHDGPGHSYVRRFRDIAEPPVPADPSVKILSQGINSLTMAELVSLVLEPGQPSDALETAGRIIREYGEKALTHQTDPRPLATALDIPLERAVQLVACFEVGRRYFARPAGRPVYIRHSRQAFDYLKAIGELRKEQLRGLYLNSRYQIIHDEVISIGSLTANIVHPREVFQPAIEHGAVAVIIAHNHPSGQLQPTLADTELTDQLAAAGDLLGIVLVDHLIIAGARFISLLGEK